MRDLEKIEDQDQRLRNPESKQKRTFVLVASFPSEFANHGGMTTPPRVIHYGLMLDAGACFRPEVLRGN